MPAWTSIRPPRPPPTAPPPPAEHLASRARQQHVQRRPVRGGGGCAAAAAGGRQDLLGGEGMVAAAGGLGGAASVSRVRPRRCPRQRASPAPIFGVAGARCCTCPVLLELGAGTRVGSGSVLVERATCARGALRAWWAHPQQGAAARVTRHRAPPARFFWCPATYLTVFFACPVGPVLLPQWRSVPCRERCWAVLVASLRWVWGFGGGGGGGLLVPVVVVLACGSGGLACHCKLQCSRGQGTWVRHLVQRPPAFGAAAGPCHRRSFHPFVHRVSR
jgi:hypothetical protein